MTTSDRKYFLDYQREWILDKSLLCICEKGRQEGFTYASAYWAVTEVSPRENTLDVWISSRDETQAKLFLDDCKLWADFLQKAAKPLGLVVFDKENDFSAYVLEFANGRRIFSLSSNPNALAGKRGHVLLDEFALHKDQRLLYRIAKPVTTWGGQLRIISTHRGAQSVFNEIITKIKEGSRRGNEPHSDSDTPAPRPSDSSSFADSWSLHTVPLQTAVAQGLVERINEKTGRTESREGYLKRIHDECIDEEQWLQEYCCIPADESTAFLSYDLIHSCEDANTLKDFDYLLDCKNPLYVGVDVARKKDLAVIDVGELVGDVLWDRLRIELQNKTFGELEYELNRILHLPQVKSACIDATGMGMQLAERAKERFGWKVEPITFTAPVKEELAFALRAAFEDKKVRIVRDDKLRADLRGIKKEVTVAGNIRFVGESEDSHCDRFWSKALRHHAYQVRSMVFSSALI